MGLADLAVWQWTLFAFVVLFFGVAKGGFGAGIGFLAMPILALALPPLLGLGLLAPLLVFADALNLRLYWRQWSWQNLRILVPTMLFGVGLGWLFFSLISAAGLRLAIGAMALLAAADNLHRIRGGAMRRWPLWTAPFFGLAVGVSSTIAHAGGPPANIYLLPLGLAKRAYQASTVLLFALVNLVKMVPYSVQGVVTPAMLGLSLLFVPLVWLGIWLGAWLMERIPDRPYYLFALSALGLSGLSLIWRGLAAWL